MESSPSFRSLCISSRVSPVSTTRLPPSPPCLSPRSPHAQSPSASIFCYYNSPSLDHCAATSSADQQQSLGSSFCGKQFSARSTTACNTSPKLPDSKGAATEKKLGVKDHVEAFYSTDDDVVLDDSNTPYPSESSPTDYHHHQQQQQQTDSYNYSSSSSPSSPASNSVNIISRALTYYELLGVAQNATAKEIRAAYRQKALHYHPDIAPAGEQAKFTDLFAAINEAYATLTEPHSRSLYDSKLFAAAAAASSRSTGMMPRRGPVTIPAGFNSYAYQFTGFKPDIWAVPAHGRPSSSSNNAHDSVVVAGAGPSSSRATNYAGPVAVAHDDQEPVGLGSSTSPCSNSYSDSSAISSVDTRNISSSWRGRNWETDQCWC